MFWGCLRGVWLCHEMYRECLGGVNGWQVDVSGLSDVLGGIFLGFLVVFWYSLRCVWWVSGYVCRWGESGHVGVTGYVRGCLGVIHKGPKDPEMAAIWLSEHNICHNV